MEGFGVVKKEINLLTMTRLLLSLFIGTFTSFYAFAIVPGQISTFEDGTSQGWEGGADQEIVLTDGPAGFGDNFFNIKTNPQSNQQGTKLATYNQGTDWAGDYQAAGITEISMDLKNFADTLIDLEIRIVLFGPGASANTATRYTSTQSKIIPPDGQWHRVVFSLSEDSLTLVSGTDTYTTVMQGVQRILIRHQAGAPAAGGTTVLAGMGLDNIQAIGTPPGTGVSVNAFLKGFYRENTGRMHTELATNPNDLMPTSQPFGQAPWNYQGSETLTAIPDTMVDWVLLELRSSQDATVVLSRKACILAEGGTVMDVSGTSAVPLDFGGNTSAYVVIRHKSHLSVLSASVVQPGGSFDFSSSVDQASGTAQQTLSQVTGKALLFAGDFDGNGLINNLDFNLWKQDGATINQYLSVDVDGNGIVNNLDFNLWNANPSKVGVPAISL